MMKVLTAIPMPKKLALFFQLAFCKTYHQACHSALDAESKILNNSGFLFSQE
jgi:hypothetical protein